MKGYRTLIFSVLLGALGALEAFDFTSIIPDGDAKGFFLMVIAAIVAYLRKITTTAIGKSVPGGGIQKPT